METLDKATTMEPQYQVQVDDYKTHGPVNLGLTTSHLWRSDSKHLVFFLARYKFASKMLAGKGTVLEVGCGDGFGSKLISDVTEKVIGTDFDSVFINDARQREAYDKKREFHVHDYLTGPFPQKVDALYSLDVIEHILPKDEPLFLKNVVKSLRPGGTAIIGTPSLESQTYASKWSKEGHVNCKTAEDWRKTMSEYFQDVFVFSMNDEVVHTGFYKMAHYLFLLCLNPKV